MVKLDKSQSDFNLTFFSKVTQNEETSNQDVIKKQYEQDGIFY